MIAKYTYRGRHRGAPSTYDRILSLVMTIFTPAAIRV